METGLFAQNALLPDGWAKNARFGIDAKGRICALDTDAQPQSGDASADIAVPGMANLHCHAFQRAMAGLAERAGPGADSFWTWRELMYRIAQHIDPDTLNAIAAMVYMEMLESGFTCVGEFHYLHHGPGGVPYDNPAEMSAQVIDAAARTGIGQTLLPVFYAQGGFNAQDLIDRQKRFGHSLDSFSALMSELRSQFPDTVTGIAPHSLRAVNLSQLQKFIEIFSRCSVHIHIAEQRREVEECIQHLGAPPVRWLLDHMEVNERWCLVHATHMNEGETRDLARSQAVVGLCPVTEANLGDGLFPAVDFLAQKGRFGIGSDSCVRIDLAEELRLLDYGQRLTSGRRTPLAPAETSSGRTLFQHALDGGAQALAQDIGALVVGQHADIVTLNSQHPALVARSGDAWLDGWIYGAVNSPVQDVYARGRLMVQNGRHTKRKQVEAVFQKALTRIMAQT